MQLDLLANEVTMLGSRRFPSIFRRHSALNLLKALKSGVIHAEVHQSLGSDVRVESTGGLRAHVLVKVHLEVSLGDASLALFFDQIVLAFE